MRVLLTGGAGYVGIHTAIALGRAGHEPLIVDDMSGTNAVAVARAREITRSAIPLLISDLRNETAVARFIEEHGPVDAVIHLAGLKSVAESMAHPVRYYEVNLGTTISLLNVMASAGIRTIVFSSSATVYGNPETLPSSESAPAGLDLANPYGKTKRVIEEILADAAAADPQLRAVSLRYFNPVGADPSGLVGEDPRGVPTNLMPIVSRVAIGSLPHVQVYGDDYDTPDGTGLRDYIHVSDLADGHVAALEKAREGYEVYNLGTGEPVSVLQLIAAFERASGRDIPWVTVPRRPGDVAASYADPAKAERALGWSARLTIDDACRDYWNWQTQNPAGYAAG